MKVGEFQINKIQIIGVVVLLVGLATGVFLVQRQQTLKSKAATNVDVTKAFTIQNADTGQDLKCDPPIGDQPATCTTDSVNVTIKVKDLNELLK